MWAEEAKRWQEERRKDALAFQQRMRENERAWQEKRTEKDRLWQHEEKQKQLLRERSQRRWDYLGYVVMLIVGAALTIGLGHYQKYLSSEHSEAPAQQDETVRTCKLGAVAQPPDRGEHEMTDLEEIKKDIQALTKERDYYKALADHNAETSRKALENACAASDAFAALELVSQWLFSKRKRYFERLQQIVTDAVRALGQSPNPAGTVLVWPHPLSFVRPDQITELAREMDGAPEPDEPCQCGHQAKEHESDLMKRCHAEACRCLAFYAAVNLNAKDA